MFNTGSKQSYSYDYSGQYNRVPLRVRLLNSKIYNLNASAHKYLVIGLKLEDFSPSVQLCGRKNFPLTLNEEEWNLLMSYQRTISNFLNTGIFERSIYTFTYSITFEKIENSPIVTIKQNENDVKLAKGSFLQLVNLSPLIEYRIDSLKRQDFTKYFDVFKNNLSVSDGNILNKIKNVLTPKETPNSENVCTMMEMLELYPTDLEEKLKGDHIQQNYL